MTILPEDLPEGENLLDGVTEFYSIDDAGDPKPGGAYAHNAKLMSANMQAQNRDALARAGEFIDIAGAKSAGNGKVPVYNSTTESMEWGGTQTFDQLVFDPQSPAPAPVEGQLYYDDDSKCLTAINDKTGSALCIGREFWVRAQNNSGSAITNGQVVYIDGASGVLPTVALAQADSFDESRVLAVCTESSIANGSDGEFTKFGLVQGLNTSAYSTGDTLYLSPTVAGGLTSTKPTGSNFIVRVATVIVSNATTGTIYVDPFVTEFAAEINNSTGWADRNAQTVAFVDGTRTLSISPTGTEFVWYQNGVQYRKTTDSIVIPDEEGLFVVYYNEGTLAYTKNPTDGQVDVIIRNNPTVAYVYWNATDNQSEYVGFECHGSDETYGMTTASHSYHHFVDGAAYVSGLRANTVGTGGGGTLPADAQFGIDSGAFADEDLPFFPSSISSTTGTTIKYFSGTNPDIRSLTQSGYSVVTDVTAGVGATGRLVYQDLTGGTYSLATCGDNTYVAYFTFAINENGSNKIQTLPGFTNDSSLDTVFAAISDDLAAIRALAPGREFLPLIITFYQTRNSYTNAVKARLVQTPDGDDYIFLPDSAVVGSSGGGTGTPGGASTQVQYNSGGVFAGDTDFTYIDTTNTLSIPLITQTEQASTPATPATGKQTIYPKTDGLWYSVDDAGTETEIGGTRVTNTTQTFSASMTPVWSTGFDVENMTVGTVTSAATFNNASVAPAEGMQINIAFQQNATGGYQITLGSNYKLADNNTAHPTGANEEFYFSGIVRSDGTIYGGWTPVDVPEEGLPFETTVAASDETTALTTGTAKVTFRMPCAITLTDVRASVTTAPTGSALTVDINESGTSVLSTKLTIDATEKTSTTAATAPVISDSALADDAEITIDIDGVGSTVAGAGLKVTLIGTRA